MLYTAFLAICLSGTPIDHCDRNSAIHWVVDPEPQHGLAMCAVHGQQYAAGAILVTEGTYLKVFCTPMQRPGNVG